MNRQMISEMDPSFKISLVVTLSNDGVIAKGKDVPCYPHPSNSRLLSLIKEKPVIVGRKAFKFLKEYLGCGQSIILSRDPTYRVPFEIVVSSPEKALETVSGYGYKEVVVVGGAIVFNEFIDVATHLYLTRIDNKMCGHKLLTTTSTSMWKATRDDHYQKGYACPYHYSFVDFERIKR